MSKSPHEFPPWDSRNREEQNIVKFCPRHKDLLIRDRINLIQIIDLSDLWPHLQQLYVIRSAELYRIKLTSTDEEQVNKLLDHLERGPCWRLHAFLKALKEDSQDHVIMLLGLDPKVYTDDWPAPRVDIGYAFQKALQSGSQKTYQCRLMLVGHHGAGKTNLRYSLLGEPFQPEHHPTNSIDADPSEAKVYIDKTINWVKKEQDLEGRIANLIVEGKSLQQGSFQPQTADVEASRVHPQLAKEFEEKYLPQVMEVVKQIESTDDYGKEKNIELFLWDFGGQSIFYTVHHTFLSNRGIYILVIDLSLDLQDAVTNLRTDSSGKEVPDNGCPKTVEEFIAYWLSSIHMQMDRDERERFHPEADGTKKPALHPPVIVVGTHSDCPLKAVTELDMEIWKLLKDKPYSNQIYRKIFHISNLERDVKGIEELKAAIEELAMEQGMTIPLTWFQFKEAICNSDLDKPYIKTLDTALQVGRRLGMEMNNVRSALLFFHSIGDVVYFDDDVLKKYVVTSPQWLIDQIKKVITIPRYWSSEGRRDDDPHWPFLEKEGCLHDDLVNQCWGDDQEVLLHLMQKFALLLPMPENFIKSNSMKNAKGKFYVIPSLLQLCETELCESRNTLQLVFLDNFIPLGFTSRLIASLVNECHWVVAGKLFRNHARLLPTREPDIQITIHESRNRIFLSGKRIKGNIGSFKSALGDITEQLLSLTLVGCQVQKPPVLEVQCTRSHTISVDQYKQLDKELYCFDCGDNFSTEEHMKWFEKEASDTIPNTRDVIDAKRATLMSTICPDCMFEAHLIQRHVMSDPQIKSLEGQTRHVRVGRILDIVRSGTKEQYDGFRVALRETHQEGALSFLPENAQADHLT